MATTTPKKSAIVRNVGGAKTNSKPNAQGFGESRIFAAPEGSFPPAEGEIDILECHVAGMPVRDLPRANQIRILYQQTDEGQAWWEANRHLLENRDGQVGPQGRGMRVAGLGEATDVEDKKILRYRDELASDTDGLHFATDPMAEPLKEFTPPGHRGLFMSERQCKEKGMVRGNLKYERVLAKNPTTGAMEPVIVGNMFLASVPEALAQKAERYVARINADKQITAQHQVREQAERVMASSDLTSIAKRKSVLDDLMGLDDDNADRADQELAHDFA
jgi:hypothetical protein